MFSEPALGEKFFGREEVLELLNKRIAALKDGYRQNIALTGQSLAGKTSIISHFLYTVKEEGIIPVYVEVIREPFKSFADKFIATLLYNSLTRMHEDVTIYLDDLLAKAREKLPKTHSAIRHLVSCIEREQYDEAYSSLLGLTSVLKDEMKMPCIVILDEFDNLEYLGIKNPFLNFGKVIMVQKDTMYIVSSSRDQAIKKILSEKLSLLFGNFEIVKIEGFSFRAAAEFISARMAGYDVDEEVKAFLAAFTDGNAFYLDKLTARARALAQERMSNHIDVETVVEAVVGLIYNSNGVIHQYLLNFILELMDSRYKETYIATLLSIAKGNNKQAEIARHLKVKQGEMTKHLARLAELGLVSKHGVLYKIDDLMLEFWLKFVYQRRRELLVDSVFDRTNLFRDDVRSYMMNFKLDLEKGPASKIFELFNKFSNELVAINSKMVRLPHFTKVEIRVFPDGKQFISASLRGNLWVVLPHETCISENDIIECVRNLKTLDRKIVNKVVVPLEGIDENAKLLAKELKITIWDVTVMNTLLRLYGKNRIIRYERNPRQ